MIDTPHTPLSLPPSSPLPPPLTPSYVAFGGKFVQRLGHGEEHARAARRVFLVVAEVETDAVQHDEPHSRVGLEETVESVDRSDLLRRWTVGGE